MTAMPEPQEHVRFRRFGEAGPAYEILGVVRTLPDGDILLKVRVLETGEEAEYRQSHALQDPEED